MANEKAKEFNEPSAKKSKKRSSMIIIICIIIGIAVGVVTGIYNVSTERERINLIAGEIEEINRIVEKDSLQDVDKEALSLVLERRAVSGSNNYALVEDAAKKFLSDVYLKNLIPCVEATNEERLVNILSIESIRDGAPDFEDSLKYLDEKIAEAKGYKDNYYNTVSKESIDSYLAEAGANAKFSKREKESYYSILSEFSSDDTYYGEALDEFIENAEKAKEVLSYLAENKKSWEVKNDMIVFNDQDVLDRYNELTNGFGE